MKSLLCTHMYSHVKKGMYVCAYLFFFPLYFPKRVDRTVTVTKYRSTPLEACFKYSALYTSSGWDDKRVMAWMNAAYDGVQPKMSPTISFSGMYQKPFIYLRNRDNYQFKTWNLFINLISLIVRTFIVRYHNIVY